MADLVVIADEINQEHEACEAAFSDSLGHARRAGELLIEAKGQVEHGEWLPWVEANCDFAPRTAQVYMRIERNWGELANTQGLALLGVEQATKLLAAPKTQPLYPDDDDPFEVLAFCERRANELEEAYDLDGFRARLDAVENVRGASKLRWEAYEHAANQETLYIRSMRAVGQIVLMWDRLADTAETKYDETGWQDIAGWSGEIRREAKEYLKANGLGTLRRKRLVRALAEIDIDSLNEWFLDQRVKRNQITFPGAAFFAMENA